MARSMCDVVLSETLFDAIHKRDSLWRTKSRLLGVDDARAVPGHLCSCFPLLSPSFWSVHPELCPSPSSSRNPVPPNDAWLFSVSAGAGWVESRRSHGAPLRCPIPIWPAFSQSLPPHHLTAPQSTQSQSATFDVPCRPPRIFGPLPASDHFSPGDASLEF